MVVEVFVRMLDWMGVHKATWASAAGVWEMLHVLVPRAEDFPVFATVKRLLIEYMNGRVEVIPICVNNCMAFYNCKSEGYAGDEWQTEDDDFCAHCGEDRWCRPDVHAPTGMNRKVQFRPEGFPCYSRCCILKIRFKIGCFIQVMYYLPTKPFVHDLFKQPDVVAHMSNSTADAVPGSIKASRGFASKITNNPVMSGRRDIALVAQSDGVPYFKDKSVRSGTICTMRNASLPEGMGKQNRNTHLVAVQPSVYLSWDHVKNRPKQIHHNPKNQAPIVTVLCDELYTGYVHGWPMIDYSMPEGAPGREFICRVLLLFWFALHHSRL